MCFFCTRRRRRDSASRQRLRPTDPGVSFLQGPGYRTQAHDDRGADDMAGAMLLIALLAAAAPEQPLRGHVTGVGGVFVRSADPQRLAAWYRDMLGVKLETWGGALLRYDAQGHPPVAVWNAFPVNDKEFTPSKREFVINFAVDDLDAILARLRERGVAVIDRQEDENGRFASILDPDGTKLELWQPKPAR